MKNHELANISQYISLKNSGCCQKLVHDDLQNRDNQSELFIGLRGLGNVYKSLKQPKQALRFFKQALLIAKKLAENKMNYQAQQDLKTLLNTINGLQD